MANADLLAKVEAGALDETVGLASVLRRCVALGGATGSEALREWASRELKGYKPDDELPAYRTLGAVVLIDGFTMGGHVTGQQLSYQMRDLLPEPAQEILESVELRDPVAAIEHLVEKGETVRIQPPRAVEMIALLNHELAKRDATATKAFTGRPAQMVERLYWAVDLSHLRGIIDVVRTTLVELVAEMRAGTAPGQALPSRDVADQAAAVAIHGHGNRVTVVSTGPGSSVAASTGESGAAAVDAPTTESPGRALMWWLVAIATIAAAVIAGIALWWPS